VTPTNDYPKRFIPLQQAAYPEVTPIWLGLPMTQALTRAEQTARSLGWNVHRLDPSAGTLESTATSRIFQFVDDIVVGVKPAADQTRNDIRSRSRLGQGDMGVNAARILRFSREFLSNGRPNGTAKF